MQTCRVFCILFTLIAGGAFSQTIEDSITLTAIRISIAQVDGSSYELGGYDIGRTTEGGSARIFRSYYSFDLADIPDNTTSIKDVEVVYNTSHSGYTFKLTKPSSIGGGQPADWSAIGDGATLDAGKAYGVHIFHSNSIKTEIGNALGSDELIIGALSENESANDSYSTLDFYLNVVYEYPAPPLDITVRNDLKGQDGGKVGVGIYPNSAAEEDSPFDDLNLMLVTGSTWRLMTARMWTARPGFSMIRSTQMNKVSGEKKSMAIRSFSPPRGGYC